MTTEVRSTYLSTLPEPVLVHHHAPSATDAGRAAVLLVPPFAWDDVASYRARREWAIALAAGGHHVVRLDLPGTGDSAGAPRAQDRLGAWVGAADGAAAWLREQAAGARVAAIGLGTGGLVAWLSAARSTAIDDLVLWSVPAHGRALVRELRAFAALKADEWGDSGPPAGSELPAGWLDVTGYVMTAETAAALSAVRLDEVPLPAAASRRVLLLERDGARPDARLRQTLEDGGAEVRVAPGDGWGVMTSGPQESRAPADVFGTVTDWLRGAGDAPPAAGRPAAPAVLAELELEGGGVVERPWVAGRPFGHQFGILAQPRADRTTPRPFGLVLLNAGAVRHTGPNRMWVEAARRSAGRGIPVLRLDIEGLGDSDGDGRPYVDTARLYAPGLAEQVSESVSELVRDGVADHWIVAGLCAGASWAFHAALADDDRVTSVILINPFAFFFDEELVVEHDMAAARRAGYRSAWQRVVAGEIDADRLRATAVRVARTPLDARARRRRSRARIAQTDAALDRLRERGKHVTLIVGQDEPIILRLQDDGHLDRLSEWPNVDLQRIPARDHTFRAPWLQRVVHGLLDEAVDAELERRGQPAPLLS